MTHRKANPGALAGATGASENVQAGKLNFLQDNPSHRRLQLAFLQSRYGLSTAHAYLIANFVFGEGGAA